MFKNISLIFAIACILISTGCKQPQPMQPVTSKQGRTAFLQHMQYWRASGRISIHQANETLNASFTWRQSGSKYRLHFYSAFSSESLTIEGDGQQITALVNKGEQEQDVTLERNLPFLQLAAWIKGLPAADSNPSVEQYDVAYQLQTLSQDGWQIQYLSYIKSGPITLPQKITATNGNTKLKILIKDWQI